jgi:hypothetical protein
LSCYKFGEPDDKSKIRENYSEIFVWYPWISEFPLTRLSHIGMLSGELLKFPNDRVIGQVFSENLAGVKRVILPGFGFIRCKSHRRLSKDERNIYKT